MPLDLSNPRITQYRVGDTGLLAFLGAESGMGKTTLVRGLIDAYGREEVLILPVENKLLPLADYDPPPLRWDEGEITHTRQIDECLSYLEAQIAQGKPVPRYLVLDALSEWSDKKYREVREKFPSREKSGSFDRFETFGLDGLDLIVRVRALRGMIKIINCTMSRRPLGDGGGWKYNLYGNIVADNLARKVDLLLFLTDRSFELTDFAPDSKSLLKQYAGCGPVRVFQTANRDGVICKDSSTKLAPFEPTETAPGKRDGWPHLFGKISPALAPKEEAK